MMYHVQGPLCENKTLSTKPEVCKLSQHQGSNGVPCIFV